eukprot:TRINITY_DN3965_c0_g1_i4.p1 TRINITY_DN3965_c0_g1~~TRINITY_DN3965_c0_g1_i4.p1  ORF type:complete len:492 (-),score=90.55 TRINITY_DN3965_c0_g1_i4:190-1626(-)
MATPTKRPRTSDDNGNDETRLVNYNEVDHPLNRPALMADRGEEEAAEKTDESISLLLIRCLKLLAANPHGPTPFSFLCLSECSKRIRNAIWTNRGFWMALHTRFFDTTALQRRLSERAQEKDDENENHRRVSRDLESTTNRSLEQYRKDMILVAKWSQEGIILSVTHRLAEQGRDLLKTTAQPTPLGDCTKQKEQLMYLVNRSMSEMNAVQILLKSVTRFRRPLSEVVKEEERRRVWYHDGKAYQRFTDHVMLVGLGDGNFVSPTYHKRKKNKFPQITSLRELVIIRPFEKVFVQLKTFSNQYEEDYYAKFSIDGVTLISEYEDDFQKLKPQVLVSFLDFLFKGTDWERVPAKCEEDVESEEDSDSEDDDEDEEEVSRRAKAKAKAKDAARKLRLRLRNDNDALDNKLRALLKIWKYEIAFKKREENERLGWVQMVIEDYLGPTECFSAIIRLLWPLFLGFWEHSIAPGSSKYIKNRQ